ncbi:unnamed protein product [Cyclocybe aegerita]|uniref:RanBD1 domain-containing protein n=1 Tax=Cyclocybe aegerita TaxID=1973307 RepID=A0A8S0VRX6_CYCAE|nr:unnamed protein product [Cyclocybe aegerita]
MSQPQEPDNPPPPSPTAPRPSPPRLTPSPDATESEFKLSRKREREVSSEPVTTPTAGNDSDPHRERKDSRTPLKKNRRRLDPTKEEDDGPGSGSRSGSGSPPTMDIVASPRQEMKIKVRQISQGVEDISWKGFKKDTTPDQDVDVPTDTGMLSAAIELPEPEEKKKAESNAITTVDDDETPPKSPDDSALSASVQDLKNADVTMQPKDDSFEEPNRLRSASESGEKGLKRKFLERGTSQGPSENGDVVKHPSEPLKRPRDASDKDENPRETKRPSPPPSPPRRTPPSPKVSKLGGFIAYASTSSPFASVKGQNVFISAHKSTATPPPFSPSPAPSLAELSSTNNPSSTPAPTKRSGFEAFASTSSPFATAAARAKSPILGSASKLGRAKSPPLRSGATVNSNPFASYVGPSQGFALPAQKRARAGSPDSSARSSSERTPSAPAMFGVLGQSSNGSDSGAEDEQEEPTTFGERLRAHKDDEDENRSDEENGKVQLTEQDVMTGEEDEETLHQVRGKLFSLHGNQWKERGTGLLKLNVRVEDGTGARLVMRKDAVYTLLLNITLFPGMRCSLAQDPRYLRFTAIENGVATTYNLKVANAKIAADLLEEVNANIPS